MKPLDLVLERLRQLGCETSQRAGYWACQCPAHDDRSPSLSVREMDNGKVALKCFAQDCTTEQIAKAIGLETKDLYPPRTPSKRVKTYNYTDESGAVLYRKIRKEPKDFELQWKDPRDTKRDQWIKIGNGKGTLIETLYETLGPESEGGYASIIDTNALTVKKNEDHSTELAKLRASRFVFADEAPSGKRWDDSKVKKLTGGTPITARFMRENFFDYRPQFLLVITGNHMPQFGFGATMDPAIKRRLRALGMNQTFTANADRQSKTLKARLREEAPGIVARAVQEAQAYILQGMLPVPIEMVQQSEEYAAATDRLTPFLELHCERLADPFADGADYLNYLAPAKQIYDRYCKWLRQAGESFIESNNQFASEMTKLGFKKVQKESGRFYVGLRLRSEADIEQATLDAEITEADLIEQGVLR